MSFGCLIKVIKAIALCFDRCFQEGSVLQQGTQCMKPSQLQATALCLCMREWDLPLSAAGYLQSNGAHPGCPQGRMSLSFVPIANSVSSLLGDGQAGCTQLLAPLPEADEDACAAFACFLGRSCSLRSTSMLHSR